VRLVFDNLLSNADKYSPREEPIEIRIRPVGDGVGVRVRDSGIGMDPGVEEDVFAPFYRAEEAKAQAKGLGLGLAVCKRVMEAQGGTIRAVVRSEGGCDFVFTLPQAGPAW
jgi:K+-sensing histidine kinase KdpD